MTFPMITGLFAPVTPGRLFGHPWIVSYANRAKAIASIALLEIL